MEAERVDGGTWLKTSLNSFLRQTTLIDRSSVGWDASGTFAENLSQRVQIRIDQLTCFCCCRVSLNSMSDWFYIWQSSEWDEQLNIVRQRVTRRGNQTRLFVFSYPLDIKTLHVYKICQSHSSTRWWLKCFTFLLSHWDKVSSAWRESQIAKFTSALRQANCCNLQSPNGLDR